MTMIAYRTAMKTEFRTVRPPFPPVNRLSAASLSMLAVAVLWYGLLTGCRKKEWYGEVNVVCTFSYGGQALTELDGTHRYALPSADTVPSGQSVAIEEIRYFISKAYLIEENGTRVPLADADGVSVHYADFALPATRTWTVTHVPCGHYVGFGFTYGLDETDNVSRRFPNAPESNMYWPDALGGGYHYMQINGKWFESPEAEPLPYGLHTGIGQTWTDGVATAFHQNYVPLEFPDALSLFLTMENRVSLTLDMDVAAWYATPWDFAVQGGAVMQNQTAQQILKDNAQHVFSVR